LSDAILALAWRRDLGGRLFVLSLEAFKRGQDGRFQRFLSIGGLIHFEDLKVLKSRD
jgi:hypothetical protein